MQRQGIDSPLGAALPEKRGHGGFGGKGYNLFQNKEMKMRKTILVVLFIVFCLATQGQAQEKSSGGEEKEGYKDAHHGKSADEIAKELANPNNAIAKLTFKNQYRWYTGDLPGADDQDNYTLLFQPVFPFSLGETGSGGKSVLFVRPAIPLLVEQPTPSLSKFGINWDGVTALGDIGMDLAYGVTEKSGFLWALGGVFTFPSATDSRVAGGQWRAGPEAVIAKISKAGIIGMFPSHQWDFAGWKDDRHYSTTSCQFFLTATPGGGWAVGTQPTLTYDWESEEWTIPLHLTVSRTVILGSRPLKLELELNYYIKQPDAFGPQWMVSFNITPIVSNFIDRWIRGK